MSFLGGIFGSRDKVNKENDLFWKDLNTISQLDEIVELSYQMPVVIFKHSTRCGISRMVLNGFERTYDLSAGDVHLYFLDLIKYREVSNEIEKKFQVIHESPQLLIIQNGEVAYHASHGRIKAEKIKEFI